MSHVLTGPEPVRARFPFDRVADGGLPPYGFGETTTTVREDILPVILGGDIGGYSTARAFHEAYGVRSIVVSALGGAVVRHSRIVESIVEPEIDDPAVAVALLRRIAVDHPGMRRILIGSADWHVRTLVAHRAQLEDLYVIPYAGEELMELVTDKAGFSRLCASLDIDHPRTLVHQVGSRAPLDTSALTFPVIAKAASTTAYHHVDFPGKKKVYEIDTPEELSALMTTVREAGYRDAFVIQDLIPGDDSHMRILTCYSDLTGRVRFASFGQVLLEEHTPGALGNPAGIITEVNHPVIDQAVRLLERIGWTGYANFDIKLDPRDGRLVFFELNPRLGRSSFYITASGFNAVRAYVHEHVDGGAFEGMSVADVEHLYTVVPRRLLLSYLADPALRSRAKRLIKDGAVTNPLWYGVERHPRRLAYLSLAQANYYRKFRAHHPRPAAGVSR